MSRKYVTVEQIQELDRIAIEETGIPSLCLMENAGRAVAQECLRILKRVTYPRVAIVCGLGHNAGDGFVAARHLMSHRVKVEVVLIGSAAKLKRDAAVNYHILKKAGRSVRVIRKPDTAFCRLLKTVDVAVDAVFGAGLNRTVGEPFKASIDAMNTHARKIVAIDIPSGLDGTTGKVYGSCVKAHTTVTFSFLKKGFKKGDGPIHVGRVMVADIGIIGKLKRNSCYV